MGGTVIRVEDISKRFGEQEVLNCVNFSMEEGKIYGLIGRNGSGKTVLMKCICGFLTPTSGKVTIFEKDIARDETPLERMGIIIEAPGFLPTYSAYKNLRLLAMIRNKIEEERIRDVIRQVGLYPDSRKRVGKFSMGMKQRLGIAQAVMEDPDILLLDEPMNGLDNAGVEDMRRLFMELRDQGKCILLASHSREDIEILCDEVFEIDKGDLTRKE